jgi:hypothetical protein
MSAAGEALELQERIGYAEGTVSALHVLGQAQQRVGQTAEASASHRRALALASRIGHAAAMCEAVEDLARVQANEHPALAASLLRAADAERSARHIPLRQRDAEDLAALLKKLPAADAATDDQPFAVLVAELTT